MRCSYCHNPHLVEGFEDYPEVSEEEVLQFLRKRQGQLGGLVVSGGEPTLQPSLKSFLEKVEEIGYRVKLDTNGTRPDILEDLLSSGLLGYVAIDVKAPPSHYPEITGWSDVDVIRESIGRIQGAGVEYELRTTVYPTMTKSDLVAISQWTGPARRYVLQQCRTNRTLSEVPGAPHTPRWFQEARELLLPVHQEVVVRGI